MSTSAGWETIIIPNGELDLATVEAFDAACDALDLSAAGRAVLDLRAVVFMDVRGLRSVLRLHEACLRHAVALSIRPGPRVVQRVFELTNTHSLLRFEPEAEGLSQKTAGTRSAAPRGGNQ